MVPQQAAPGQIAAKMLSWDTKHPLSCPSGFWHSLTSSRVKFRRLTAHSTNGTWQDLLYSANIWVIQSSHIFTPKIAQPKIHLEACNPIATPAPSPWCLPPALGTPFSPAIFGRFWQLILRGRPHIPWRSLGWSEAHWSSVATDPSLRSLRPHDSSHDCNRR